MRLERKVLNKINYKMIVGIMIIVSSILLSVFQFNFSFLRIKHSFIDVASVGKYIVCYLTDKELPPITINDTSIFDDEHVDELPVIDIPVVDDIPILTSDIDVVKVRNTAFWNVLFNDSNVKYFLYELSQKLSVVFMIVMLLVPLLVGLYFFIKWLFNRSNNDYGVHSLGVHLIDKLHSKVIAPLKESLLELYDYLSNSNWFKCLFFLIWLFNFNAFTIIIEFIAYYFYLIVSFDFSSIFVQLYKLFVDLLPMLLWFPKVVLVIMLVLYLLKLRKDTAFKKLRYLEKQNAFFVDNMAIVTLVTGTMGKKKTTIITDMALTINRRFRNKALELILECEMKFPYFDWQIFIEDIKKAIYRGECYNLASCSKWCKHYFNTNESIVERFDYNSDYGFTYDNKLVIEQLTSVLVDYTKLFFILFLSSSLIVSNYAIREDGRLVDSGNLPLWSDDFFSKDSKRVAVLSRFSHILDYNMLRLGKLLLDEDEQCGFLEFGVFNLCEIGKERMNALELQGVKKNVDDCNQKNDLFEYRLMMIRHPATVMNYSFVKLFMDEQRADSLGAKSRQLADILDINSSNEKKTALAFNFIEQLFVDLVYYPLKGIYEQYRHNRADTTILSRILTWLLFLCNRHIVRIRNLYGYIKVVLNVKVSGVENDFEKKKYYLCNKKIYSNRFKTDCYNGFFEEKATSISVGLNDLPCYVDLNISRDEYDMQNSFFIRDMNVVSNQERLHEISAKWLFIKGIEKDD